MDIFEIIQRTNKEKRYEYKVAKAVEIAIHKLPHMENLYVQAKDQAEKMQRTVQRLANDIRALERKISILDKTVFSCEQDCKRKEQRVQEITAQKDGIEKLIANILNGEGYSKLKQIVKENVKVVLSENKMVISVSFAAIIHTLKADPQLVKLIHNIPSANDNLSSIFESNLYHKNSSDFYSLNINYISNL